MNSCRNCGWAYSGKYCPKCGIEFIDVDFSDSSDVTLSSVVTDSDMESVARRNIWSAMHEDNFDKSKCMAYAVELRTFFQEDYYADFVEAVCIGNDKRVSKFLDKSKGENMEMYSDAVLDYLCKHLTPGIWSSLFNYNRRAFPKDSSKYEKEMLEYAPPELKQKIENKIKSELRYNNFKNFVDQKSLLFTSLIFFAIGIVLLVLVFSIRKNVFAIVVGIVIIVIGLAGTVLSFRSMHFENSDGHLLAFTIAMIFLTVFLAFAGFLITTMYATGYTSF